MKIDLLIDHLVQLRKKYGNVEVGKMVVLEDDFDPIKCLYGVRPLDIRSGTLKQILTISHPIYVKKNGDPLMVTLPIDEQSKEDFTYTTNNIITL